MNTLPHIIQSRHFKNDALNELNYILILQKKRNQHATFYIKMKPVTIGFIAFNLETQIYVLIIYINYIVIKFEILKICFWLYDSSFTSVEQL